MKRLCLPFHSMRIAKRIIYKNRYFPCSYHTLQSETLFHRHPGTRRLETSIISPMSDSVSTHSLSPKYMTDLVKSAEGWNDQDWDAALQGVQFWKLHEESSDLVWHLLDRAFQENGGGRRYKAMLGELLSIWGETPGQSPANEVLSKLQDFPHLASKLYTDIHTLTKIIDAAIKNGEADAYLLAEHVIDMCPNIDQKFAGTAINALAKSGVPDAPQRAEFMVAKMKKSGLQPNSITMSALIEIWVCSGQSGAAQRAEEILLQDPIPDAGMFGSVLKAWRDNSADRCIEFFWRWQRLSDNGTIKAHPTNVHYGTVIDAFAKEGRAQEAENVMQVMMDTYSRTKDPQLAPDRIHFTTLINANRNNPERAEQILMRMLVMAENHPALTPNNITFNAVLKAWANRSKSSPCAVERAMAVMDQMKQSGMEPDTTTYNTVLSCLANSRGADAPRRAQDIINTMRVTSVSPDIVTFNSVIDLHAKSNARDAPEQVEALLNEMSEFCEPDIVTFNTAILAWSRSRRSDAVYRAEELFQKIKSPDKFSYNALLDTYSRNGNTEEAEHLLKKLCQDSMANKASFRTIMNCWAKSRHLDAGFKAEAAFCQMTKRFGELRSEAVKDYTTLVSAWANSGNPQGATKANEYLNKLKLMGLSPDTSFYSAVINANATVASKDPAAILRVFALLDEMMKSKQAAPNLITYNSVLKCLSRSSLIDKANKALSLLKAMERSVSPDIRTLDEVLAACAYSDKNSSTEAHLIAFEVFRCACERYQPSARTFGLFFLAAVGHEKELKFAYRLCCDMGFQNDPQVRKHLEMVAPQLIK